LKINTHREGHYEVSDIRYGLYFYLPFLVVENKVSFQLWRKHRRSSFNLPKETTFRLKVDKILTKHAMKVTHARMSFV